MSVSRGGFACVQDSGGQCITAARAGKQKKTHGTANLLMSGICYAIRTNDIRRLHFSTDTNICIIIYIYIHICMCIYISLSLYIYIYTSLSLSIYIYIYIYIWVGMPISWSGLPRHSAAATATFTNQAMSYHARQHYMIGHDVI